MQINGSIMSTTVSQCVLNMQGFSGSPMCESHVSQRVKKGEIILATTGSKLLCPTHSMTGALQKHATSVSIPINDLLSLSGGCQPLIG